jgi:uroporphyrinogen decarboxylase
VQVFDSWAGELSPASFKDIALPYLEHICNHLPKRLEALGEEKVPMVVFAKGAWYALEDLCKTKYDVVGLDWLHDPAQAYSVAQKHGKVVQGNADPGVLYGGHEAITEAVKNMVGGFGGGKQGWIANLGHGRSISSGPDRYMTSVADISLGITPFVNPEDLKFFFEEIHRLSGTQSSVSRF